MNNEYFTEMHKLSEKARVLERMGREEEALNIYLEIHATFFPNTSDLYERPAIILEKRKRFDEAIHICEKAIKLINEGKVTGIKENFTRRIERITSRSDYNGTYSVDHSKKVLAISFKSKKVLAISFKGCKVLFKKLRKPTETEIIALLVIVSFIGVGAYLLNNKPKSQFEIMLDMSKFEHTSQVDGNAVGKNIKDLPPITSSMIAKAVKETESMMGVRQAGVILQKDTIGFVLMLEPGSSKAQAKEAAESFVKALGSAAASENSKLSGPGIVGYGELFDYYYLIVAAGENIDNLLLKGTKNPKIIGIYWR